jgi:hypothetical protein
MTLIRTVTRRSSTRKSGAPKHPAPEAVSVMLKPVPLMGNCLIKTDHLWTDALTLPARLLEVQSNFLQQVAYRFIMGVGRRVAERTGHDKPREKSPV